MAVFFYGSTGVPPVLGKGVLSIEFSPQFSLYSETLEYLRYYSSGDDKFGAERDEDLAHPG
jgi:hypothetical protein